MNRLKRKATRSYSIIGLAMAGHAQRADGNDKKAVEYDNPLTDFINLEICEAKSKLNSPDNDLHYSACPAE